MKIGLSWLISIKNRCFSCYLPVWDSAVANESAQPLLKVLKIVWTGLLTPSECWASNRAGKRTWLLVQWSFRCTSCRCLWLLFQKKTSGLLPWESLPVIPSWAHRCLEKCWQQPTTLVWNCTMKEEVSVYLNSALTTAWSIWKGLGRLWNVQYFLCLKVGDKIPADLLRAEVASGLTLLKKKPHFWPQLHRNDPPACDLSPVLTRSSTYWLELPSRTYI